MNNTTFEMVVPQKYQAQKVHGRQVFTATVFKRVPFVAASLSVVMSAGLVDSSAHHAPYCLAFANAETCKTDLAIALERDYEVQSQMLQKLEYLKNTLTDNWNGEGDLPMEDKAYLNMKAAIISTSGNMLKHWRLFPNPNGTLLLSPKDKSIAGVSIGNEDFSYAVFVSDDNQLSGKEPFSVLAFKSALKQIHRILGYA